MKRYIDTIEVENPELIPIIVNALEKDMKYEVELCDNAVADYDPVTNRKPEYRYRARLKVLKIEFPE